MRIGILQKVMLGYGLVCLVGAAPVHAKEIFVNGNVVNNVNCGDDDNTGLTNDCNNPNGNGPTLTIGQGIALANQIGDQVTVSPGLYIITNNIDVPLAITISCFGSSGSCVIEGGASIENPDDAIATHGFTIVGDNVTGENEMSDPDKAQATIDGFTIQDSSLAGISILNASPVVQNCMVQLCGTNCPGDACQAGGIEIRNTPTVTDNKAKILNSSIINNSGGSTVTGNGVDAGAGGGGIVISDGTPTISGCTIEGNTSGGTGGGIMVMQDGRPTIKNCLIANNTAHLHGGGIGTGKATFRSSPQIINCTVVSNHSIDNGAGIELCQTTDALVQNCLIAGNIAGGDGGGMWSVDGDDIFQSNLVNNTIANNDAFDGGGIAIDTSTEVANNILFENTNRNGLNQACLFRAAPVPVVLTINYSDIQGGKADITQTPGTTLAYGDENIDVDPLFVDFDGVDNDVLTWADNNFHVMNGSPIIDAASNLQVPADESDLDGDGDISERTPFDLDNLSRFVDVLAASDTGEDSPDFLNLIVDMGVYEVTAPTAITWQSIGQHGAGCSYDPTCGGAGGAEYGLDILPEDPDPITNPVFNSEPRSTGLNKIVVTFDQDVNVSGASIMVSGCNVDGTTESTAGITMTVVAGSTTEEAVMLFSPSLPGNNPSIGETPVKYEITLDGVTGLFSSVSALPDMRIVTAIAGDANPSPIAVNNADLGFVRSARDMILARPPGQQVIDPDGPTAMFEIRSDIDNNNTVSNFDLGIVRTIRDNVPQPTGLCP